MRILAFDTATAATTVAFSELEIGTTLRDGDALKVGRTVELRDDPPPGERPRHGARLLALITDVLEQTGTDWEGIDRIAVGVGPGTFTGLRIGVATAKALGRSTSIPLVGISTLHSLVVRARLAPEASGAVVAVLDARRGEVFAGAWQGGVLDELASPLLSPRALGPEALAEAVNGLPNPMAIGDGAVAYRGVLESSGVYVPEDVSELHRVTATSHCLIAPRLQVVEPDGLLPDYQRPPDAKPRATPGPGVTP